jgi:hypothetical protein
MAIEVTRRARRHPDRAGDPLDGLVNLFDVGIVLAVGFLLAGMAIARAPAPAPRDVIAVSREAQVRDARLGGRRVLGEGRRIGSVYQLSDGRTIVVRGDDDDRRTGGAAGAGGAAGNGN